MKLTPEVKLCFDLVKSAIEGVDFHRSGHIKFKVFDLNVLINLLSYHELWGEFCRYFNSSINLLKEKDRLQDMIVATTLMATEFWRIKEGLNKENIEVIPLKGLDIFFRKEDLIRSMGDLDLLIKEEDINKAENILKNLGYRLNLCGFRKNYRLKKHYHLQFSSFINNPPRFSFRVELHWKFDIAMEKILSSSIWERSKVVKIKDREVRMLTPEDCLISFALHQRHFGKMFCLKYVIDAGLLIEKYSLDWNYLLGIIANNKLQNLFYYYLYQLYIVYPSERIKIVLNKLKLNIVHKRITHIYLKFMLGLVNLPHILKLSYISSCFFFHENLWRALQYILFFPQEGFARFYNLEPYKNKTSILYSLRPIVFLFTFLYSPVLYCFPLIKDVLIRRKSHINLEELGTSS